MCTIGTSKIITYVRPPFSWTVNKKNVRPVAKEFFYSSRKACLCKQGR